MNAAFVAVEGPTGAGKTTLTGWLVAALDAAAVFDPVEANPFLAGLLTACQPTEALALRVEPTYVALRVAQLLEIAGVLAADRDVVADWALCKQPVFAATRLAAADVARVAATVEVWAGQPSVPGPVDRLVRPGGGPAGAGPPRGRDLEAGLSAGHLDSLGAGSDAASARWTRPLVRLDAARFRRRRRPARIRAGHAVRQHLLTLEVR